jgi:hypothetical protein
MIDLNKVYLAAGLMLVLMMFVFIITIPDVDYVNPTSHSNGYNESKNSCMYNREFCKYPLNLSFEVLNASK